MDSMRKFAKTMSRQLSAQTCLSKDDDIEAAAAADTKVCCQTEPILQRPDPILQRLTSVEERNHRRKMRQIFQLLDTNHNGTLDVKELKAHLRNHKCKNIPDILVNRALKINDEQLVSCLDFEEFYDLSLQQEWFPISRFMAKYCEMIVPSPGRDENDENDKSDCPFSGISFESLETADSTDGAYEKSMHIWPPPLTMVCISLVEIIMFLYDVIYFSKDPYNDKRIGENINGPAATLFIYNSSERYQVWRFITYMFVHVGVMHILMNLIIQIFLGVALELVHQWWRVALVYLAGVLAGSMGTSIVNPEVSLAGASGGVYALIAAHLATIIMNWAQMEYAVLHLFVFLVFCVTDFGLAAYRHMHDIHDQVGYVAHISGAVAGLLVGIGVLRNLKVHRWERMLWWFAVTLYFLLMLTGISIHIFYADHFKPSWC